MERVEDVIKDIWYCSGGLTKLSDKELKPWKKHFIDRLNAILQAEKEHLFRDFEVHHSHTVTGHTPPQMHFIFGEPTWAALKQKHGVK